SVGGAQPVGRPAWEPTSPGGAIPSSTRMRRPIVLTLTENAATEIRQLIDDPQLSPDAGLRIANDPASGGISLALAVTPAENDRVVDEAGAPVFLEPQAAALLDDKVLDAGTDSAGQVQFRIADLA